MSSSVEPSKAGLHGGGDTYQLALTHRSYAFERAEPTDHNERLEFLGDAILEAVVTELIYSSYPDLPEGDMARLRASVVNTQALAGIARQHDLGRRLLLGRGEEASGGRDKDSILANAFEAIVGAIFVDAGFEHVREVLIPIFAERLDRSVNSGRRYDVKTALQEIAVRDFGRSPQYKITSTGPDHDKRFEAEVFIDSASKGRGVGRSKKEAEYYAAQEAIEGIEARGSGRAATEESHARAG